MLLIAVYGFEAWRGGTQVRPGIGDTTEEPALLDAYRAGRSDVWVEVEAVVVRRLPDDWEGSPHQRFIVRVGPRHTLLVSHNLALAPRVEALRPGDRVRIRGEYEWNELGGVVHWTHHDPEGRRPGGYIELRGRRYR